MRFNPPPNWPPSPAGWTPPAGWSPDPSWGPTPAGWQLWVDDTSPTPSRGPKRRGRWIVPTAVGVVALLVGIGIGNTSKTKTTTASSAAAATPATVTVTETAQASAPAQAAATVTVTATAPAPVQATPTAAPAVAKPAVIADIKGNGIKQTGNFNVQADQWTIAYAFDCTAFGQSGNFSVSVYTSDGTPSDIAANAIAIKGQDSTVEHGAGTYYLQVDSECSWHIVVTG